MVSEKFGAVRDTKTYGLVEDRGVLGYVGVLQRWFPETST